MRCNHCYYFLRRKERQRTGSTPIAAASSTAPTQATFIAFPAIFDKLLSRIVSVFSRRVLASLACASVTGSPCVASISLALRKRWDSCRQGFVRNDASYSCFCEQTRLLQDLNKPVPVVDVAGIRGEGHEAAIHEFTAAAPILCILVEVTECAASVLLVRF